MTTVSGTKNNSHNPHNAFSQLVAADKDPAVVPKKNKSGLVTGAKDKTGAPKTPPLTMNHVTTAQDRRNEVNPQNENEVEEMETQDGKPA